MTKLEAKAVTEEDAEESQERAKVKAEWSNVDAELPEFISKEISIFYGVAKKS